jgi:hypothetical protein
MKKIFYILISLLLISSCETWDYYNIDDFNYGEENHTIKIFLTGGISTQYVHHRIYLTKPGSYVDNTLPESIITAKVFVSSGIDTMNYELITELWDGYTQNYQILDRPYYLSIEQFKAEIGKSYTLNIEYDGEVYTATEEAVPADDFNFTDIPSPQWVKESNVTNAGEPAGIELDLKKHHYGFPKSNKWIWSKNSYLSDTVDYNSTDYYAIAYSHKIADVQGVFSNINYYTGLCYDCLEQDTIVVVGQSLSDGYYNYLRQRFIETDWKEGVFASISGNLPTNLSTSGAGYFYVADFKRKEIIAKDLLNIIKVAD